MAQSKIIALIGTTASGKTTMVRRLATALGLPAYTEDVDDNPLLTAWYQDRLKWNYWIQLFFHSRRVVSQFLAERQGGILERTLFEDLIFLELSLEECNDEAERAMLLRYKLEVEQTIRLHRRADRMIYLKVTPAVQRQRISRRAREAEDVIDQGFLTRLNEKYIDLVEKRGEIRPTLVIDTDPLGIDDVLRCVTDHVIG